IGALGFEAVRAEKRWSPEDITLLRTVGDIFASALERGRIDGDRRELEARLRQSERMEAIGTLAGGIAHNFNNILGAIAGYGEMALSTLAAGGQARRHIEQVMIASRRARDLVDQILTFSRRGMPQRQLVRVQP